jgi:hypothetical protein
MKFVRTVALIVWGVVALVQAIKNQPVTVPKELAEAPTEVEHSMGEAANAH